MKIFIVLWLSVFLMACSDGQVEEYVFRKTMEYSLVDLCGELDQACIDAVKSQIKDCMIKSDWRSYLNQEDDEQEMNRFMHEFYGCIVDKEGKPYFVPEL